MFILGGSPGHLNELLSLGPTSKYFSNTHSLPSRSLPYWYSIPRLLFVLLLPSLPQILIGSLTLINGDAH